MKGLRIISEKLRRSHRSLHFKPDDHLCSSCRKRVAALPEEIPTIESSQSEHSEAEEVELRMVESSQSEVEVDRKRNFFFGRKIKKNEKGNIFFGRKIKKTEKGNLFFGPKNKKAEKEIFGFFGTEK